MGKWWKLGKMVKKGVQRVKLVKWVPILKMGKMVEMVK